MRRIWLQVSMQVNKQTVLLNRNTEDAPLLNIKWKWLFLRQGKVQEFALSVFLLKMYLSVEVTIISLKEVLKYLWPLELTAIYFLITCYAIWNPGKSVPKEWEQCSLFPIKSHFYLNANKKFSQEYIRKVNPLVFWCLVFPLNSK